ncbi:MAG TPA: NAD(P)H-binding protein, partial [Candidatus Binataceae bacterium]|nr:NAD(P)H-binding protein [Candidatus Binataceae bacterium]
MPDKTVALAGGSGFIGRAIARRLAAMPDMRARVMSRSPQRARERLEIPNIEFVRAEVTDPASLPNALQGASAVVCSVQFEGYPIENPKRGLTFERVDYGGTVALLEAAKKAGTDHFVYISGAAA